MTLPGYRHLIGLLAMFCLCLVALSCSRQPELPPLAENAVVVAFGDSLTFGTGAGAGESYPEVLEQLIGHRVVKAGVPGEVSADSLPRLAEVLDREHPALLLLCHGGNDQLRRLDPRQTGENLRAMIRAARERGVAVALIAVPAPGLKLAPPAIYKELAKEFSLPMEAEILADILADSSLKSAYIHPNAAGYRRLAEAVAALLRTSGAIR
jgi:lysophospholipase L1-like esterase